MTLLGQKLDRFDRLLSFGEQHRFDSTKEGQDILRAVDFPTSARQPAVTFLPFVIPSNRPADMGFEPSHCGRNCSVDRDLAARRRTAIGVTVCLELEIPLPIKQTGKIAQFERILGNGNGLRSCACSARRDAGLVKYAHHRRTTNAKIFRNVSSGPALTVRDGHGLNKGGVCVITSAAFGLTKGNARITKPPIYGSRCTAIHLCQLNRGGACPIPIRNFNTVQVGTALTHLATSLAILYQTCYHQTRRSGRLLYG